MKAALIAARRPEMRPRDLAAAAVRALGRLAFAALVAFHAWLLLLHVAGGRAFEPATAARWALSVLVLAGFVALRRRGIALFAGRRAVVLWLLVVVIHCSAVWDGGAGVFERAIPEAAAAVAQFSFATAVIGLALLASLASSARPWMGRRAASAVPGFIAGLPATGLVFSFSPRPPPLA